MELPKMKNTRKGLTLQQSRMIAVLELLMSC